MTTKVIVGGLIVKDGKFVMVKEKKAGIMGLWNLTLGHLEGDETILDGAKREMEEESGFNVKLEAFLGVYQHPHRPPENANVIKIIFLASVMSGELRCPPDLLDVRWISFEEFKKMPLVQQRDGRVNRMIVEDYLAGKRYPIGLIQCYG